MKNEGATSTEKASVLIESIQDIRRHNEKPFPTASSFLKCQVPVFWGNSICMVPEFSIVKQIIYRVKMEIQNKHKA